MTSGDFVPPATRQPGLRVRTYRVDAAGQRHDLSPVVKALPTPGPPPIELQLDFWPDCACPRHRAS